MSFSCRLPAQGRKIKFSFFTAILILFLWTLWKRHADVFNGISRYLSFPFNGIISHCPAIKIDFSWSPSLHYGHTASYKIHQNWLKKNHCRFFLRRSHTNGQLSFIDEWQERKGRKKFLFSIIFPSGKIVANLTNCRSNAKLLEEKFKTDDDFFWLFPAYL